MSAFAVGDKVVLVADPSHVMEVVELADGKVICSFKEGDKRKIKPFSEGDIKKP
ncbi:MAG: hypothetical protein SFY70_07405 [Bacteroidia bacterium]|nr:hypothetical protein [Bacteroidia bacterium]